jgi:methionyl-tRNA formyltransferase
MAGLPRYRRHALRNDEDLKPGAETMKISILTDNPKSWFVPYGTQLAGILSALGHDTTYVFRKQDVPTGDICFLLSCVRIVEDDYLNRNHNTLVVHASDLPHGKGFAPLQWQILEGKQEIIVTLLEAIAAADAGPYYLKSILRFDGTELHDELRQKLATAIIEICLNFVASRDTLKPIRQEGEGSVYPRRTEKDDELDASRSIAEQFNHFRIADNERCPLYFRHLGQKYIVKIYKDDSFESQIPTIASPELAAGWIRR